MASGRLLHTSITKVSGGDRAEESARANSVWNQTSKEEGFVMTQIECYWNHQLPAGALLARSRGEAYRGNMLETLRRRTSSGEGLGVQMQERSRREEQQTAASAGTITCSGSGGVQNHALRENRTSIDVDDVGLNSPCELSDTCGPVGEFEFGPFLWSVRFEFSAVSHLFVAEHLP